MTVAACGSFLSSAYLPNLTQAHSWTTDTYTHTQTQVYPGREVDWLGWRGLDSKAADCWGGNSVTSIHLHCWDVESFKTNRDLWNKHITHFMVLLHFLRHMETFLCHSPTISAVKHKQQYTVLLNTCFHWHLVYLHYYSILEFTMEHISATVMVFFKWNPYSLPQY